MPENHPYAVMDNHQQIINVHWSGVSFMIFAESTVHTQPEDCGNGFVPEINFDITATNEGSGPAPTIEILRAQSFTFEDGVCIQRLYAFAVQIKGFTKSTVLKCRSDWGLDSLSGWVFNTNKLDYSKKVFDAWMLGKDVDGKDVIFPRGVKVKSGLEYWNFVYDFFTGDRSAPDDGVGDQGLAFTPTKFNALVTLQGSATPDGSSTAGTLQFAELQRWDTEKVWLVPESDFEAPTVGTNVQQGAHNAGIPGYEDIVTGPIYFINPIYSVITDPDECDTEPRLYLPDVGITVVAGDIINTTFGIAPGRTIARAPVDSYLFTASSSAEPFSYYGWGKYTAVADSTVIYDLYEGDHPATDADFGSLEPEFTFDGIVASGNDKFFYTYAPFPFPTSIPTDPGPSEAYTDIVSGPVYEDVGNLQAVVYSAELKFKFGDYWDVLTGTNHWTFRKANYYAEVPPTNSGDWHPSLVKDEERYWLETYGDPELKFNKEGPPPS